MVLLKKTSYNTKITELENKISDTSSLVKKTDYNTKITEIESKIPDINNLATKNALTTVENKIPNINNLATKTALTTVENIIPDVSSIVKKTDYNTRVAETDSKITKNESIVKKLVDVTREFLLYYPGNIIFGCGDGFQAYLIFQSVHRYIKIIANNCLTKVLNLLIHLITVLHH